jgi:hypothetical protein
MNGVTSIVRCSGKLETSEGARVRAGKQEMRTAADAENALAGEGRKMRNAFPLEPQIGVDYA